ncbi:MAG: hypothetical protein ACTSQ8_25035 [Candidatus Helarchaeota archaeon]
MKVPNPEDPKYVNENFLRLDPYQKECILLDCDMTYPVCCECPYAGSLCPFQKVGQLKLHNFLEKRKKIQDVEGEVSE